MNGSRPWMNPENPFGVHLLKFFVAIMILVVHGLVIVAVKTHYAMQANKWIMYVVGLYPSSMLVPLTAGAMQGLILAPKITANRLRDFQFAPFARVLLLLAFVESLKAAFTVLPSVFFAWNVLHMIAVSLLVILALAQVSVHLVWISAVLCFALTPIMRDWLRPWLVSEMATIARINDQGWGPLFVAALGFLTFGFYLWAVFRWAKLERKYRLRLAVIGLVLFNVFLFLMTKMDLDPYFAVRLIDLPLGALVGDPLGLHYWPLFPWYSNVAFGFLLYLWWAKTERPALSRALTFAFGALLLAIYFSRYHDEVIGEFDAKWLWGPKLFGGSLGLVIYAVGSFSLFACAFDAVSRARWYQQLCANKPLFARVPYVYSKTILWAYLFMNTLGIPLAALYGALLPQEIAINAFPISAAIGWYWLGEGTIEWLARRRFTVRLSPAR